MNEPLSRRRLAQLAAAGAAAWALPCPGRAQPPWRDNQKMPGIPDYYTILGLPRDATPEEVRRAYHQSAMRLHPDVNVEAGDTELFLDIQKAFDVLADPDLKAKYDRQLPPADNDKPLVEVNMLYSRSALPILAESQLVYVLLDFTPPHLETASERAPLNVCLVLDRSTSMKGERMDMVKTTAIEIIRQIRRQDIISIVTFIAGTSAQLWISNGTFDLF